jgi:hypothetical protein
MTVHDNPVKRIRVVRKIGGKLVVDHSASADQTKASLSSCSKDTNDFSCLLCRNGPSSPVTPIEAA